MSPEIEALLALQDDDAAIRGLETQLAALEPRRLDLERQQQVAADALARAEGAVLAEERRQKELTERVAQHRLLHERNVAQLDSVRKMKEATAAISQVEQARRVLAEEESELHTINRRLEELRAVVVQQIEGVAALQQEQTVAREALASERAVIDAELATWRGRREAAAKKVARPLLAKYDRINARRRDRAVFALRGQSCGSCDTAIPLQRRNQLVASGGIELCEACGVLLYATS